jgi:hypothetical protein
MGGVTATFFFSLSQALPTKKYHSSQVAAVQFSSPHQASAPHHDPQLVFGCAALTHKTNGLQQQQQKVTQEHLAPPNVCAIADVL